MYACACLSALSWKESRKDDMHDFATITLDDLVSADAQRRDTEDKLRGFLEHAEGLVDQYHAVAVEDDTYTLIGEHMKTIMSTWRGCDGSQHVGCMYQVHAAGETVGCAHLRSPKYRPDHLKKLVKSICHACGDADSIPECASFMISDAGKHGNESAFSSAFTVDAKKSMDKHKEMYYFLYNETSIAQRRVYNRGHVKQIEMMHLYTKAPLKLNRLDRKHFEGTNLGNVIGPLKVPGYERCWRLPVNIKDKLLGARGKITQGKGEVKHPEKYVVPAFDDGMVPVSWHSPGEVLYDEIIHSFGLTHMIFMCNLDEEGPFTCIQNKIPSITVTFSEAHRDLLRKRLVTRVWWDLLLKEDSDFYQIGLAEIVGEEKAAAADVPLKTPQKRKAPGSASGSAPRLRRRTKGEQKDE